MEAQVEKRSIPGEGSYGWVPIEWVTAMLAIPGDTQHVKLAGYLAARVGRFDRMATVSNARFQRDLQISRCAVWRGVHCLADAGLVSVTEQEDDRRRVYVLLAEPDGRRQHVKVPKSHTLARWYRDASPGFIRVWWAHLVHLHHARTGGEPTHFSSVKRLAEVAGQTTRHVRSATQWMEAHGVLRRDARSDRSNIVTMAHERPWLGPELYYCRRSEQLASEPTTPRTRMYLLHPAEIVDMVARKPEDEHFVWTGDQWEKPSEHPVLVSLTKARALLRRRG